MRSFAFLLLAQVTSTIQQKTVVHERRNQIAAGHDWNEHAVEDRSIVVRAAIGLQQRKLEDAYDHIVDM